VLVVVALTSCAVADVVKTTDKTNATSALVFFVINGFFLFAEILTDEEYRTSLSLCDDVDERTVGVELHVAWLVE
jgi:TRAP-type C4-dicarboxylate transport system permease large subunit